MKLIPAEIREDLNLRIESVKRHMKHLEMDALIVATATNLFYTTSRVFKGYVYIHKNEKPIWFLIKPDIFENDEEIIKIRKPEEIPAKLSELKREQPKAVGYEFDDLSYSDVERLKALFPEAEAKNGSKALRKARMVKTPLEIVKMKEDGVHQSEAYRRITRCYKEGMTDLQFQIEIEKILRLEGCLGYVRTAGNLMDINLGSVIAGDNADNPSPFDYTMGGAGIDPSLPEGANGTTLKIGETVMVDMNGSFNGYQTDMTRVWALGEISELARKAHQCSINILRKCEKIGVPGFPVSQLYKAAEEIVEGEGLKEYFMGHRQKAVFIGHGVGIELNEMPVVTARSKDNLEENMTIALEPKFVIPGVGAVGVENTYLVTPHGLESITIFPEEIQEL